MLQTLVTTHTGGVDWNWGGKHLLQKFYVTTHTGGVDWNSRTGYLLLQYRVTTHTGGVDWNTLVVLIYQNTLSHHPHGWCGLKYNHYLYKFRDEIVTTHTGGVDWNKEKIGSG